MLNEYNYIDNYTEINKLDSALSLNGWTVTVYTPNRTTVKALPATGTSSCFGGIYQVSTFASNEVGTAADLVLKDGNGDVVDILRVRTSLPVTTTYYGPKPACTFVGTTTDLQVSSGNKGVDRLPDGTGDWRQTPGTGSNSFQSPCAPNIGGGSADLALTKTVSPGTVVKGAAVTFTLTVTNNDGSGPASSVLVSDLLPAGFSYSSSTASTGSYSASTGIWTIGNMAVGATATLTLTATTTLVATLTNTATVASSTFDPSTGNNTASASVLVTSPGATLDAVEVTAGPSTAIYTKLSGTGFSLDILALAADGSVATGYNKTVTIELVDASSSATCSAMTSLQSVGAYTFTGSGVGKDNGRKTYAFNYPKAARNIRVRMKDNSATPIIACSTDNFAIRPSGLTVTSSANADNTGVSATATPTVVAGATFTLTATATAAGYDGTPLLSSALVSGHAGSVASGTVTGVFSAALPATGAATGAAFTYSEVGYFRFGVDGVYDDNFTAVDQATDCSNDYSNTLVGGKYGCKFGNTAVTNYFGRFIPDHFDTGVKQGCSAGSYTYSGQPFSLSVTARNKVGDVSRNYDGASTPLFAKALTLSDANVAGVGTFSPVTVAASAFSSGVATLTPSYTFTNRQTAPTAIKLRVVESAGDGVSSSSGAEGVTSIRSGRVRIFNAYGSEQLDLPMTLRAEYWNGAGWVQNTDDNCTGDTALGASNAIILSLVNPAVLPTCVWDTGSPGRSGVGCSTAGSTSPIDKQFRTGAAMVTGPQALQKGDFNLWFKKPGASGAITVNANVPPWLEYGWTSAASEDPLGRATFGSYRSPIIYRRENY